MKPLDPLTKSPPMPTFAMAGKKPSRDDDGDTSIVTRVKPEEKTKLQKPKLYKVLLHNDNYTTRDFVVFLLMTVFNKPEPEAVRIMLHVHNNGVGVAGVYTYEVAETKVATVIELARQNEYPLMCSMEPE
jgi:ATP-dependent Clp protease adaptor protein ClpS